MSTSPRPQGKGVIHIGFLSSTKILSLNRTINASAESALRSGDVGLMFCWATLTSRTAVGVGLCCAPASSLFHSSSPPYLQAALSRSHPSGSRPDSPGVFRPQKPGPIPTPSGPEQRQYRTLFNRCPSRGMDVTDPMTRLVRRGVQPCLTQSTGERESIDLQNGSSMYWTDAAAVQSGLRVLANPFTRSAAASKRSSGLFHPSISGSLVPLGVRGLIHAGGSNAINSDPANIDDSVAVVSQRPA